MRFVPQSRAFVPPPSGEKPHNHRDTLRLCGDPIQFKIAFMKKLRVGVLFGGRSGEHEVSLLSAASVLKAIDKSKYDVVPIGITKEGRWVTAAHAERLLKARASDAQRSRPLRA